MMTLSLRTALALSVAGVMAAGCTQSAKQAQAQSCDRTCLVKLTDDYLAALVAHDPGKVPLAANLGFVENLHGMKPGEGLWKSATGGPTKFSIHVPDVDTQEAAWMGVMDQDGKPVLLALRLKVKGGKITEAEHLIAAVNERALPNVQEPRAGLLTDIPQGERLPHDELARIGATYYDALDDNDGSKMPFADDCQRRENGITTAGEGAMGPPNSDPDAPHAANDCKGQMDSNSFEYIKYINHRRIVAADPVTGLVMGISQFRHPFDNLPYTVTNSDGSTTQRNAKNMPYKPFDMPAAHIFKIGPKGLVHEIEAVGFLAPYKSPTGWQPS